MIQLSTPQILSILLLVLVAAMAGLAYRSAMLKVSETEIINRHVQSYLAAEPDGEVRDCHAVPGVDAGVRLVVVCARKPMSLAHYYEFHAGPLGGLIRGLGPADWGRVRPLFEREGI